MTTVLSPIEFDHLVQVVHHRACGHRAECWCGWASAWCDDYATADEASDEHRRTTAGPATAFDATLSRLLDLQDDLADAVLWLADKWSSDLPVPDVHARTQRSETGECAPSLELLVHCASPDALVGLAELLAAPVVAEPRPDPDAAPHLRATRAFGRVRIEAYTDLPDACTSPSSPPRSAAG